MFIKTYKPRLPSLRHKKNISFYFVTKKLKFFCNPVKNKVGRGDDGSIITRHKGHRHKRLYVTTNSFKNLINEKAVVINFSKNKNNKPFLALLRFTSGYLTYINAPNNIFFGSILQFPLNFKLKEKYGYVGNLIKFSMLRAGDTIFNIFSKYVIKVKWAKSAGSFCKVLYQSFCKDFFFIKLPSGLKKKYL